MITVHESGPKTKYRFTEKNLKTINTIFNTSLGYTALPIKFKQIMKYTIVTSL